MKFLIVKSAFCPNEHYLDVTIGSLIKINMFVNLLMKNDNNIIFDLYFIGWVHTMGAKIDLCFKLHKFSFSKVDRELWGVNYGKYKILNCMIDYVKNSNTTYDAIIYLDHDIHFDIITCNIIFNDIVLLKDQRINSQPLGMIAFNQKGDVRHQMGIHENKIQLNSIECVWPEVNGPIASGAFVIFPDVIKQLTPFELVSVYGLDDYALASKLTNNGYINVVMNNLCVVHPYDYNIKYTEWKRVNILRLINGTQSNYFTSVEEMNNSKLF